MYKNSGQIFLQGIKSRPYTFSSKFLKLYFRNLKRSICIKTIIPLNVYRILFDFGMNKVHSLFAVLLDKRSFSRDPGTTAAYHRVKSMTWSPVETNYLPCHISSIYVYTNKIFGTGLKSAARGTPGSIKDY